MYLLKLNVHLSRRKTYKGKVHFGTIFSNSVSLHYHYPTVYQLTSLGIHYWVSLA